MLSKLDQHNKKAMIIANTSWNIQNFRLNIIQTLLDNDFEVVTVAPDDEFMEFLLEYPKVRHIPLRNLSRKSLNPIVDIALLSELRGIYKKEQPDITIHYTIKPNIYGSIAANHTGNKCISVITGLGYTFIHNGMIGWVSKKLYRFALKTNQKVIFENNDDRLLFIDQKILSKPMGISVKGCGIDSKYFAPRNTEIKHDNAFLFIGRLLYDKGIREFVEAARMVRVEKPDAKFWVAGNIDEEYPAAVTEKDLQVWIDEGIIDYKGFVHDVRDLIHQSSCVVLPSYREAIARALQEGMAMGRPVISTNVAGCREAVDHGENGFLVPVKNAKALADAMLHFLTLDEARRSEMGKHGRAKVLSQFDERIIAKDYMDIVNEVLDSK